MKLLMTPFLALSLFFSIIEVHSKAQPILNETIKSAITRRRRDKDQDCDSKLDIEGCSLGKAITISRIEQNLIRGKYVPDPKCNIIDSKFDWFLRLPNMKNVEFKDYFNKDVFIIEPYQYGTGTYFLSFRAREKIDNVEEMETTRMANCRFTIKPEIPIAKITGEPEVTAVSGEDYKISGEESIDMDFAPGQPGKLIYRWTCTQTGTKSEFCKEDLGKESHLIIPWTDALDGATYTVTLSVKTKDVSEWQSTQQIVHFKRDLFPVIEIVCLANCPPHVRKTDRDKKVMLEAVCVKDCKTSRKYKFQWYIDIDKFDYDANSKTGQDTRTFQINESVLKQGETYLVYAVLRGTEDKVSIYIEVGYPPTLHGCSVTPNTGIAIKTIFTASCKYEPYPGNYVFEIYSRLNNIDVLLGRGEHLKDLPFSLSAGSDVLIRISDNDQFSDNAVVKVTVTSLLTTKGSEEDMEKDIMSVYFDDSSDLSITKLLKENNFEKAFYVANSLIDDMDKFKKQGKEATATKFCKEILDQLGKMPLNTETEARQIGAVAAKVTQMFSSKSDPEIAAKGTQMCKDSSEMILKELKKKEFPNSFSGETKDNLLVLAKCSNAINGPNIDVIKPDIESFIFTTPFPLLDVEEVTENYPDYVDDQKSSKAMKKYHITSNTIIDLCYTGAKQLAIVSSHHDDTHFMESDSFNLTSTVRLGTNLLGTKIQSHDITMIPSSDFNNLRSAVHLVMCTSTENLFWWIKEVEIFTSVAIVQFNVNDKPVNGFQKPFTLTFETHADIASFIDIHRGATPKILENNTLKTDHDFERMSIHRIDVFKKQPFIIKFIDLPADVILDVVITDFYKPSFEEFQKKTKQIDGNNNTIFIPNNNYYDSWYYMAVLPSAKMKDRDSRIQYKFSIYTLSCFRWAVREAKWIFACSSHSDSSVNLIICECYHSSAMAGMIANNEIKVEKTLIIEELELETQASYIIFASVAGAFFLYCVFLSWFSIAAADEILEEPIFFLSDIPISCRYGYVLIVKTGNKSKAGTTSNVMIKIYGTNSESNAHVLNYPDPEKQLLQKNEENWFFIATEFYLGDIEKIELWCDFIGYNPAWFCSELEIFDIQQNKYWSFQVNTWFEVLKNEQMTYTAYPTKPGDVKKRKVAAFNLLKKFFNSFRGAHMWNLINREEQTITRMKRLHIIFSIFLTTYAVGLYLYGCPKLENSDSLSYTIDYGIDTYVILIAIGCFILTFTVHFPIVWFFRYPRENVLGKRQKVFNKYSVGTNSLCWCLLITNIIISMTILMILGFWVPHTTGLLWLTSVAISLLVYIFIMENFMRVIVNFTTNQKTRVQKIFEQIKSCFGYIEQQRVMLYNTFGSTLLRPFFGHLYKPLDKLKLKVKLWCNTFIDYNLYRVSQKRIIHPVTVDIWYQNKEQRHWAEIKERLWEIVQDLIMITIYVLLLYLVIMMDRDATSYVSHVEIEDLIKGTHSRTILLDDVYHRNEIENYIEETLITSMHSLQWYGKYVSKNPGTTIDKTNKYLGIARLRQHRASSLHCDEDFINQTSCYPTYYGYPEYRNFSENWLEVELSNQFSRMDHIWKYVSERVAGTVNYFGTFAVYPGGGYIATLGRTQQNSLLNFNYMRRNSWIDSMSRCIFIEFLLYNPCNNLFNSIRITFEIYATGYTENNLEIQTARLLFVKEETSVMVWIILFSFIIMLIILIIKLTHRIIRKRKLLLKDIWHVADIFIILISLTCLGLYIARSDVVRIFLSDVESAKNNEFVNYFHLMYTESSLTIVAAILVFLATLRLWKLMRFMTIVKVVEKTLILSAPALLSLFLCQLVFIFACAFFAITKYGDHDYDFRGVIASLTTLFVASLNFYDFNFDAISGSVGYLFYSGFMLVTLGIYTIDIAIITISYGEAQFFYSSEEEYNIVDLLKERCQYYGEVIRVKWRKLRLRGGNEKGRLDEKVYPKDDEFRYANCVTLQSNKMDAMTCVTKCLLRNMRKDRKLEITDKDADLIKHTIVNLFRKDTEEKEIFFTSNVQGEKFKFVDDKVMLKMQGVVEAFLSQDDERSERMRRNQLYKKIIESHTKKMDDIAENLNVLSNVLKAVNIRK